MADLGSGDVPVRAMHVQHGDRPDDVQQGERDGHALRQHRGQGRAGHAEPEHRHGDEHEHDVQQAADHEEDQRGP